MPALIRTRCLALSSSARAHCEGSSSARACKTPTPVRRREIEELAQWLARAGEDGAGTCAHVCRTRPCLKMFSETLRPEPQVGLTAGSRAEPRPGGREGRIPRR